MKIISSTEARKNWSDLINKVKYQKIVVAIGRNNKAEVLITPVPDSDEIPITQINADSSSFDFLKNEPDLYSLVDLKKKYV